MRWLPFLILLNLAACVGPPSPRRPAAPPAETPAAYRQCLAAIAATGAEVQPLPDRVYPNGCSATAAVKLVAIGIPVTNLGAVKCALARPFIDWVRAAVQSAANRLGGYVVRIESYGSFACRPVNNAAGARLSEHGRANAIDIAAFVLKDGRRITVRQGWDGPDERVRLFLRDLHAAACRRFAIVLGPEANALHADHFHVDMGAGRYCR